MLMGGHPNDDEPEEEGGEVPAGGEDKVETRGVKKNRVTPWLTKASSLLRRKNRQGRGQVSGGGRKGSCRSRKADHPGYD